MPSVTAIVAGRREGARVADAQESVVHILQGSPSRLSIHRARKVRGKVRGKAGASHLPIFCDGSTHGKSNTTAPSEPSTRSKLGFSVHTSEQSNTLLSPTCDRQHKIRPRRRQALCATSLRTQLMPSLSKQLPVALASTRAATITG